MLYLTYSVAEVSPRSPYFSTVRPDSYPVTGHVELAAAQGLQKDLPPTSGSRGGKVVPASTTPEGTRKMVPHSSKPSEPVREPQRTAVGNSKNERRVREDQPSASRFYTQAADSRASSAPSVPYGSGDLPPPTPAAHAVHTKGNVNPPALAPVSAPAGIVSSEYADVKLPQPQYPRTVGVNSKKPSANREASLTTDVSGRQKPQLATPSPQLESRSADSMEVPARNDGNRQTPTGSKNTEDSTAVKGHVDERHVSVDHGKVQEEFDNRQPPMKEVKEAPESSPTEPFVEAPLARLRSLEAHVSSTESQAVDESSLRVERADGSDVSTELDEEASRSSEVEATDIPALVKKAKAFDDTYGASVLLFLDRFRHGIHAFVETYCGTLSVVSLYAGVIVRKRLEWLMSPFFETRWLRWLSKHQGPTTWETLVIATATLSCALLVQALASCIGRLLSYPFRVNALKQQLTALAVAVADLETTIRKETKRSTSVHEHLLKKMEVVNSGVPRPLGVAETSETAMSESVHRVLERCTAELQKRLIEHVEASLRPALVTLDQLHASSQEAKECINGLQSMFHYLATTVTRLTGDIVRSDTHSNISDVDENATSPASRNADPNFAYISDSKVLFTESLSPYPESPATRIRRAQQDLAARGTTPHASSQEVVAPPVAPSHHIAPAADDSNPSPPEMQGAHAPLLAQPWTRETGQSVTARDTNDETDVRSDVPGAFQLVDRVDGENNMVEAVVAPAVITSDTEYRGVEELGYTVQQRPDLVHPHEEQSQILPNQNVSSTSTTLAANLNEQSGVLHPEPQNIMPSFPERYTDVAGEFAQFNQVPLQSPPDAVKVTSASASDVAEERHRKPAEKELFPVTKSGGRVSPSILGAKGPSFVSPLGDPLATPGDASVPSRPEETTPWGAYPLAEPLGYSREHEVASMATAMQPGGPSSPHDPLTHQRAVLPNRLDDPSSEGRIEASFGLQQPNHLPQPVPQTYPPAHGIPPPAPYLADPCTKPAAAPVIYRDPSFLPSQEKSCYSHSPYLNRPSVFEPPNRDISTSFSADPLQERMNAMHGDPVEFPPQPVAVMSPHLNGQPTGIVAPVEVPAFVEPRPWCDGDQPHSFTYAGSVASQDAPVPEQQHFVGQQDVRKPLGWAAAAMAQRKNQSQIRRRPPPQPLKGISDPFAT